MPDSGLLQALDYVLNRSNKATVEILAEAVVKRRRDLSVFSTIGDLPDPQMTAKQITEKINSSIGSSMEGMKNSVRDMIVRILEEHAPELNNRQINELCEAWLPDTPGASKKSAASMPPELPADVLLSMIEQFVSFSHGDMNEQVDYNLRKEIGEWPARYWDAFPPVVQQIVSDYLKNKISDRDFKQKIVIALGL